MLTKLPKKNDRIINKKYLYKNSIRIWNGKRLLCEHGKRKDFCKHEDCIENASSICQHGNYKARCKHKDCIENASAICKHKIRKARCIECTPESACASCKYFYVDPCSKYKPYCFKCYCV